MTARLAVVIPTYHRPTMLRRAVTSLLADEVQGFELSVVVAVSDPADVATRRVGEELARDPRVRMVVAAGRGPAAARNAGMAGADWDAVAFIDDDCVVTHGWAMAGVAALRDADIVQGRTVPVKPVPRLHHFIRVEGLTHRWETCNLFASRPAVDRAGPFDETLLSHTRVPWGEDTEWGWRLLRHGARPSYCADALVLHEVFARTIRPYLEYHARMRHFPLLLRSVPELRSQYFARYFWNRRHAVLTGALAAGVLGGAAGAWRRRRLAVTLLGSGTVLALAPLAQSPLNGPRTAAVTVLKDFFEFACLVTGSIRWRRLLL